MRKISQFAGPATPPGSKLSAVALAFFLWMAALPTTGLAASETYRGNLTPQPYDESIPIVVEVETMYGTLSGNVKTKAPVAGEGRITVGHKRGENCRLYADIGNGQMLMMEGRCSSGNFDGVYQLSAGENRRRGSFKLSRVQQQDLEMSAAERRRLSETTSNSCLKNSAACLVSCPRGNVNAEFLCVTSCRHKREACEAGARQLLAPAAGGAF